MKIKFSKAFLYLHLVFSFIVQQSCGYLMAYAPLDGNGFYGNIITISLINLIQFLLIRNYFHRYALNAKCIKLCIWECICAVALVAYNLLMNVLVYNVRSIYFIDLLVYIILAIPFVISMSKIEE